MKEEQKQLKKAFATFIESIETTRGKSVETKEVKPLAMKFMIERLGLKNDVDCLVRDYFRHRDFDPELQSTATMTEKKTRLCEIAAGLEEMSQLNTRLSAAVRQAITEET